MGLNDAYNCNAGPPGNIYATAPPNISGGQTLYRYTGATNWEKIDGPGGSGTKKVAAGANGAVYMTTTNNEIYGDESATCSTVSMSKYC